MIKKILAIATLFSQNGDFFGPNHFRQRHLFRHFICGNCLIDFHKFVKIFIITNFENVLEHLFAKKTTINDRYSFKKSCIWMQFCFGISIHTLRFTFTTLRCVIGIVKISWWIWKQKTQRGIRHLTADWIFNERRQMQ